MSNQDLLTIDKTPSTDLEKFQALRIEAILRELNNAKKLLAEIQEAMEKYKANEIEVVDPIIFDSLQG